jgi:hypothetical protein
MIIIRLSILTIYYSVLSFPEVARKKYSIAENLIMQKMKRLSKFIKLKTNLTFPDKPWYMYELTPPRLYDSPSIGSATRAKGSEKSQRHNYNYPYSFPVV